MTRDLSVARENMARCRIQAEKNHLYASALCVLQPQLEKYLDELTQQNLQQCLMTDVTTARKQCLQHLDEVRNRMPLIKVDTSLSENLQRLRQRREELNTQWEEAYKRFSWWSKIKYFEGPDFSEIDKSIAQLKELHERLHAKHAEEFVRLDRYFTEMNSRAEARIAASQSQIEQFIAHVITRENEVVLPFKAGMLLSMMSVPVSLWRDVSVAGSIYDALRKVNGHYAGMSDGDIWLETLFMPAESLVGLASLVKGAYFEQLVAADTGGVLFEYFNNPGTDIVIDGVAYQLKATSSAAYVNSVDADIPVIATSEVAEQTRAIDSGFSNIELEHSVGLALGGSVIDIKDTAVDALLIGVGGLGLFATLQGVNHAAKRYHNGGDAVEAIFSGAGVAIEGTARALVNTAELGFKVLTSAPSRFVGRTVLAGLKKLDDKLAEPDAKSK
ncbi:hypothetical protein [Kerstersia similis]|uniref:hypothetical protein n=1 Tax=Kerstersia similis TaxID=206505 RepID=UPI0039EF4D76